MVDRAIGMAATLEEELLTSVKTQPKNAWTTESHIQRLPGEPMERRRSIFSWSMGTAKTVYHEESVGVTITTASSSVVRSLAEVDLAVAEWLASTMGSSADNGDRTWPGRLFYTMAERMIWEDTGWRYRGHKTLSRLLAS